MENFQTTEVTRLTQTEQEAIADFFINQNSQYQSSNVEFVQNPPLDMIDNGYDVYIDGTYLSTTSASTDVITINGITPPDMATANFPVSRTGVSFSQLLSQFFSLVGMSQEYFADFSNLKADLEYFYKNYTMLHSFNTLIHVDKGCNDMTSETIMANLSVLRQADDGYSQLLSLLKRIYDYNKVNKTWNLGYNPDGSVGTRMTIETLNSSGSTATVEISDLEALSYRLTGNELADIVKGVKDGVPKYIEQFYEITGLSLGELPIFNFKEKFQKREYTFYFYPTHSVASTQYQCTTTAVPDACSDWTTISGTQRTNGTASTSTSTTEGLTSAGSDAGTTSVDSSFVYYNEVQLAQYITGSGTTEQVFYDKTRDVNYSTTTTTISYTEVAGATADNPSTWTKTVTVTVQPMFRSEEQTCEEFKDNTSCSPSNDPFDCICPSGTINQFLMPTQNGYNMKVCVVEGLMQDIREYNFSYNPFENEKAVLGQTTERPASAFTFIDLYTSDYVQEHHIE